MKDTAVVLQQVGGIDKSLATTVGKDTGSRGSLLAATGSSSYRKDVKSSVATKKQSKMLLRELCVDKDYLEHLTIDPSNIVDFQINIFNIRTRNTMSNRILMYWILSCDTTYRRFPPYVWFIFTQILWAPFKKTTITYCPRRKTA